MSNLVQYLRTYLGPHGYSVTHCHLSDSVYIGNELKQIKIDNYALITSKNPWELIAGYLKSMENDNRRYSNEVGTIIRYTGQKPEYIQPGCISKFKCKYCGVWTQFNRCESCGAPI